MFQYADFDEFAEESDLDVDVEYGADKDDADFEPKKKKYSRRVSEAKLLFMYLFLLDNSYPRGNFMCGKTVHRRVLHFHPM